LAASALANFIVSIPSILFLSFACGAICYYGLHLNTSDGRFLIFVLNLFITLSVAESIILLISLIAKYFIVGIAAGAFVFGAFMVV
jgi:hypothetical protein